MEGITIITPSFNRAYTLKRLYDSLCIQKHSSFEWIVIDDGSTDETRSLIEQWIEEAIIDIKYYYQSNKGKHIAHNLGVNQAKFDLITCLDSDDWFHVDALNKIDLYRNEIFKEGVCGLIGLDTYENGEIVGDVFLKDSKYHTWNEIVFEKKISGDKTIVFRSDLVKKYPFPENNEDKHMPPSYQLFLMSEKYKFRTVNELMKYVEYLPDGITNNIRSKYKIAPNNYAEYRMLMVNISPNIPFKFKSLILLNLSNIYSENKINYNKLSILDRFLAKAFRPFSYILFLVLNIKGRNK